jgi:DNA-binding NarL/FixJ family response regulator
MARLIVIDDETVHRRGIEHLGAGIEVIEWHESWPDTDRVLAAAPEVALADVSVDETLGYTLGPHQRLTTAGLRVVIHTSHGAAPWLSRRSQDLGCRAFLSKRTPLEQLRDTIVAVARGHTPFIEHLSKGAPCLPLSPSEILAVEQELTGLPCYLESGPDASPDGFRKAKQTAIDKLLATGILDNARFVAPDRLPAPDADPASRRAVQRRLAMQIFARLGYGTLPTPTLEELGRTTG